jgi:hypothetical protein
MDETIRLTGRSWFHPHIVTDGLVAYTNFANVLRVGMLTSPTFARSDLPSDHTVERALAAAADQEEQGANPDQ